MKTILTLIVTIVAVAMLAAMPVSAVPYTEQEMEDYLEAIYCETVWAEDFDPFQMHFVDIDFDDRLEIITMETGDEYAPKNANIYAAMDAELSGRGSLKVGKLFVCRDPKTEESFVVNRMIDGGKEVWERITYHADTELIEMKPIGKAQKKRLQEYNWTPVIVTQEQWDAVQVYEDSRELFMNAYTGTTFEGDKPPVVEPAYGDSASTYTDKKKPMTPFLIAALVAAVVLTAGIVTAAFIYRKKEK